MTRQHGISANTYKRFIIDSGVVYTGYTTFASPGTLLGATRGGSTFTLEQEIREMEVDGAHGPVLGSRRITMVKASLAVNFIEHTLDNLKRIIVGSASAVEQTNWNAITRGLTLLDADYLSDIVLIGEVSGDDDAMGIKLDNVISDGNIELALTDKEEGVIAATFTAHFTPTNLGAGTDTEPWSLIWPDPALPA